MNFALRGGHLVDPANGIDEVQDVFLADGKVVGIGKAPEKRDWQTIEAQNCYVLPGLIDLCARLREPGEEDKATLASELRAAARGGITTLICPPDTLPVIDTPAVASLIKSRAEALNLTRVLPLGALTVELAGERLSNMAMLMQAGCVGLSNGLNAVENTLLMRRALQYAATFRAPVFLTPQDPWLRGNGCAHEGQVSTWLGLPAIPEAAETVALAKDWALIETTQARAHIELVSCARSVSMIGSAQALGLPISAGASINHLLLDEAAIGDFNTQAKVFPPLRTANDRTALCEGLKNGQITTICSDHQPHNDDAKRLPFAEAATGISGLDSLLSLSWRLLETGLSVSQLVAALTQHPADLINSSRGQLGIGSVADVCVFDPRIEWTLNPDTMLSRGHNNPFCGETLKGRVTHTFCEGRLVFDGEK